MVPSVMLGVICHDSGDPAYDAMCRQRCRAALAQSRDTTEAAILELRDDVLLQLIESMESDPRDVIVLIAADTEPRPGFLSRLLAAAMPSDGAIRVFSPQVRGVLAWDPLPRDWGPAVRSRLPHQAVMFRATDWPRLAPAAGAAGSALIDVIIDAADHHHTVDEAEALSFRPTSLAHHLGRLVPRFDIRRCGGAVVSAASADLQVGTAALTAWIALSACDLQLARASLTQWQEGRAQLSSQALGRLPRWMTHCDQHTEGIIHESLLCENVVDQSREALAHTDLAAARRVVEQHPDVYCAAVAVMALVPEQVRGAAPSQIPKVIVQGWFDTDLPLDAEPLVDAWITLHPTWQHRLFDSASAEAWLSEHFESELVDTFRHATPVAKSNLFRYAYLSVEGGVWSDVDDRPTRAIDDLTADRGLVVLRESNGAIGDDFVAVTPGHPVLVAARDEAFRNEHDGYSELQWLANGPGMFTRKMANWIVGAPDEAHLDYLVMPGTAMIDYLSVHENLAYKSSPIAWDALVHRIPEGALLARDGLRPRSRRQQALLTAEASS